MGVLVTYIKTPIYATLWIILLGYITRFFPYGQRNISSVMLAISEELDQSSRMAGASWFTTLRRITIPLLKPGIFAGWVLLFIIFLRELSISIILYTSGTETLSVGVYYLVNFENEPLTAALSIAQTIVLLVCIMVFRRVAGREALTVRFRRKRRQASCRPRIIPAATSRCRTWSNGSATTGRWTASRSPSRAASS